MIAYQNRLILLARRLALVALLVVMAGVAGARAELRLDITRGRVEPMPIAISTFHGQGGQENRVGRDIAQVVSANLERSGLFRPLDPKVPVFVILGAINWIARWYRPEGSLHAPELGAQFADHLIGGLARR